MDSIKSFTKKVYEITRKIPKGKVATYGQIARLAGNTRASRAVGMLMKNNPDAPRTPCHRVIASDGSLHGYSGGNGIPTKKSMLFSEGVIFIKGSDMVDLEKSLWRL
jgi:methylated-DNA-protein-cysteine methyltransferase related protein